MTLGAKAGKAGAGWAKAGVPTAGDFMVFAALPPLPRSAINRRNQEPKSNQSREPPSTMNPVIKPSLVVGLVGALAASALLSGVLIVKLGRFEDARLKAN